MPLSTLLASQVALTLPVVLAVAARSPAAEASPNPDRHAQTRRASRFRGRGVQLSYVLIDVVCILGASSLAFLVRFPPHEIRELLSPATLAGMDRRYVGFLVLEIALTVLFSNGERLYRTPLELPFWAELLGVSKAVSFATLVLVAFLYLSGVRVVSRAVVIVSAAFTVLACSAWRYAKRRYVVYRIERGIGARNALIVGAGRIGQALALTFESEKQLGYRFVGFLEVDERTDPRTLGGVEDLGRLARTHFIDDVFITIPSARSVVKQLAVAARRDRFSVEVVPDLYDGLGWNAPLRRLGRLPVMDLHGIPIPASGLAVKRAMDVLLSTAGLLLTLPLLALAAVWIHLDSPGPAFYCAPRVGRKGRIFRCYKLRTMVGNADQLKPSLRVQNQRAGAFFKIADDPRITRVGRLLRRYSFDELPQLWNVLRGEMSLVGPRPHPLDDFDRYELDDLRRLEVKPGITGLWQITARRDPSFETSMRLDLAYIENWNLEMDIGILLRTFVSVLRAEGC